MEPQISICIPYYNGREVISRCLRSIFSQTVYHPHDVEIVIVDDCSTDGSWDILQGYVKDGLIKLIRNEARLGLTKNWNRALGEGKAEIVCLLHQDDWYDPHTIASVIKIFQLHQDLALAAFGQIYHPADGASSKDAPRKLSGYFTGVEYFRLSMNLEDTPAPSTVFFRRSYLEALNPYYNSDYLFCSELDLYLRLTLTHPEAKFAHYPLNLVQRGLVSDRFSVRYPGYRILDFCRILENYLSHLEAKSEREQTASAARRQIVEDVKAIIRLDDITQLNTVMDHSVFQNWLHGEPRNEAKVLKALREFNPSSAPENMMLPKKKSHDYTERTKSTPISINPSQKFISDYLFSPVFIVGFHHAGTRLISQFLQEMGVFQVVDRKTNEWGYIQELNTSVLPEWFDPQAVRNFDPHAGSFKISPILLADLLIKKGYTGDSPWGHKDHRTCVTLEAWLEVFPSAIVVHIMRDPLDVLGTLPAEYSKFTPANCLPQQDLPFWADLWMAYLERVLAAAPKIEKFIELRFEDLCRQPRLEMLRLAHDLGLPGDKPLKTSGIQTGKIGIYAKWMEEGRLDPKEIEILKIALSGYRQRYGYEDLEATRTLLQSTPAKKPELESILTI